VRLAAPFVDIKRTIFHLEHRWIAKFSHTQDVIDHSAIAEVCYQDSELNYRGLVRQAAPYKCFPPARITQ
jgi:hypothetical protein